MKLNRLIKNKDGYANLVPIILSIVITFALLYVGAYVNGTVNDELSDNFGKLADQNDSLLPAHSARARMNNTTYNFDSAISIVQVTIIITVLAAAIGAIFLFTKFRA